MKTRTLSTLMMLLLGGALLACDDEGPADPDGGAPDTGTVDGGATDMDPEMDDLGCDAEPQIRTTADGVAFVRTPDACFADLPDWPYAPRYVEIDGLRQAYAEAGPADGPVVLLLHGQPTWSYLYRKMIPPLADAGFRVIAMDHLGMGRSDKPVSIDDYSYLGHNDRLERFIDALDLQDINLFAQDWGSLIGLRVVGLYPDLFARIAIGDGMLPVVPAGFQPFPPVDDPDEVVDIPSPFAAIPAQQPLFYDGCERLGDEGGDFGAWMTYAMKAVGFRPSEVVESLTWFDLPDDEEAAYDAPFPSRPYMAGVRVFPSLVNELAGANDAAWAGLMAFEKPFLTVWAANDPGNLGACETQQRLIDSVPGAAGLNHTRLDEASHFLQDDQGAAIGRRLAEFFRRVPMRRGSRYCEILVVGPGEDGLEAEVWGTQGISDCPADAWDAIDADAVQAETGAVMVIMNGPRLWIPNSTTGMRAAIESRVFGALEMNLLARLEIEAGMMETSPYTERSVQRTTTFTFDGGEEIYELTSPDGAVYVMQSLSQIDDRDATLDGLGDLAARLSLPDGWAYTVRIVDDDLAVAADGVAVVIQDDLGNTYQRR